MDSEFNSPSQSEVLSFNNVDYSHPNGTIALRSVSFKVNAGELLAILGSNGAGKTTLVRHLNGLLKPTRGTVQIFGKDTKTTSCAELSKKVGIVFQNPNNQLFEQSVKKEIEFALSNYGFSKQLIDQRTSWALETFSLSQYAGRAPTELSGGEKKRLCIALVLAWDPDVLILDEPTVGQDSEQKEKLSQTIRLLLTLKKTVILVTHDVEFVWPLQPRILVLADGRIISDGDCRTVLSNEDVLHRGNILPPQLVLLARLLALKDLAPVDTYEARSVLKRLHHIKGD